MIVLAVILVVLILIALIPIAVLARYNADGPLVQLRIAFIKINLITPGKDEDEEESEAEEDADADKKSKKEKKKKEKQPVDIGGTVEFFSELLDVALELLSYVRRRLLMKRLILRLSVGGRQEDPALYGVLYGQACAAIGGFTPVLENIFCIRRREVTADINFYRSTTTIFAETELRILFCEVIHMAFRYGIRALRSFLAFRKSRKRLAAEARAERAAEEAEAQPGELQTVNV